MSSNHNTNNSVVVFNKHIVPGAPSVINMGDMLPPPEKLQHAAAAPPPPPHSNPATVHLRRFRPVTHKIWDAMHKRTANDLAAYKARHDFSARKGFKYAPNRDIAQAANEIYRSADLRSRKFISYASHGLTPFQRPMHGDDEQ